MNRFIFWHNLPNSTLDIQELQSQLQDEASSPIHTIDINDHCKLSYTTQQPDSILVAENDNTLVFCPTPDLGYRNHKGKRAIELLLDDYSTHKHIDANHLKYNFSLIILNKDNKSITAFSDKFGIEPLFYYYSDHNTIISNHLNCLVAVHPGKPSISLQAIYNFIDAHVIPSPLTIYADVYKFEPCQSIQFLNNDISKQIYWLPSFNEGISENQLQLEERTRHALSQAIHDCGVDDTTAAFLSGGLDSSTVAGYMAKNNPDRKISTYTMGFEEAGYDETEYARIAADHFGTNLRSYYVTPDDVADAFSEVVSFYDEPFGNSSAIPSYLCAKFAQSEGVKTMLAGDGGDEIFAGNSRYVKQQIFELYYNIPTLIRKNLFEPLLLNSRAYTKHQPFAKAKSYVEQAIIPMPDRMERYNFINHFNAGSIFEPDFLNTINQDDPICQKREVYQRPLDANMLNRMLYTDWKFTLADNDLIKVNTACRLAGINVKYPMLNDDLVQLSTQIPSKLKIQKNELRAFYKASLKNVLPDQIINKKKHGFGLPFGEWLKKSTRLQEKIYDNLESLKKREYVDARFINNIIEIHRTQQAASFYGTMVWILAVLEEWLDSRNL